MNEDDLDTYLVHIDGEQELVKFTWRVDKESEKKLGVFSRKLFTYDAEITLLTAVTESGEEVLSKISPKELKHVQNVIEESI